MCSRHVLHHPIDMLGKYFQATVAPSVGDTVKPSYNIAPSHQAIVVVVAGERRFVTMEAGLISPSGYRPKRFINARAETIDTLPTFREAFRKRRCLIPMSGFYEPDHVTNSKEPFYFHFADDRPFAAAGIWERTQTEVGKVYSYSIVTVPANKTVAAVHDRMPAILDETAQSIWLDPYIQEPGQEPGALKTVLKPYAGNDLVVHRVSRSLYKNLSIGADCIEPLNRAPEQPSLFG
jgi:putative SOS response-associated peptidase YedK